MEIREIRNFYPESSNKPNESLVERYYLGQHLYRAATMSLDLPRCALDVIEQTEVFKKSSGRQHVWRRDTATREHGTVRIADDRTQQVVFMSWQPTAGGVENPLILKVRVVMPLSRTFHVLDSDMKRCLWYLDDEGSQHAGGDLIKYLGF